MANKTFAYLIGFATSLALVGLCANLFHLQELMKKDNEPKVYDHPVQHKNRVLLQDLLNEHGVFSRLVKESASALDQCPMNTLDNKPKVNQSALAVQRRLGRFGFTKALNNYLTITPTLNQQQQSTASQCTTAPEKACHIGKYSMLVTFHGGNLRTLFLNLLSWVTYPQVSQILVLLPPSCNTTIHQDVKYGERLLRWHAETSHAVTLEFTSSFWKIETPILEEAVVWLNGNVPDKFNHRGLEAGLELWKRDADAVVSPQGWKVTKTKSLGLSLATPVDNLESSQPFCKHDETESIVRTTDDFQIPDLHYLIIHRNFMCFLAHTVLQTLHAFTASAPSEERLAISILFTQLSGRPPRIFPANIKSEGILEKRKLLRYNRNYDTNSHKSIGSPVTSRMIPTSNLMALFAPRRLQQYDVNALTNIKKLTALGTSEDNDKVDEEVVTELLGFFGSLPRHSMPWCLECPPKNGDVPVSLVPWMTETCNQ